MKVLVAVGVASARRSAQEYEIVKPAIASEGEGEGEGILYYLTWLRMTRVLSALTIRS